MARILSIFLLVVAGIVWAAPHRAGDDPKSRARELSLFLEKERDDYAARENDRKDLLETMDRLNRQQNEIRSGMSRYEEERAELEMALANLTLEVERQRLLEQKSRAQLADILKTLYQVRRDGFVGYVLGGGNLADLSSRVRTLTHSVRMGSQAVEGLKERVQRLHETESQLRASQEQMDHLIARSASEGTKLRELLEQKRRRVEDIRRRQSAFESAEREYEQISRNLSAMFAKIEKKNPLPRTKKRVAPSRRIPLPVDGGRLIAGFGKNTNERFHTISMRKGIEIEAPMRAPVEAVLPGVVEFEGWVKGLGNVVIIHHGDGFYSLSGHLHKIVASKGDEVRPGEVIGFVGDTGRNDKPSLYFELRENANAVDPIPYFSPAELSKIT